MYDEDDLVAHFGQLAVSKAVAEGKTEQEARDGWHKLPSQDEMSNEAEHEEYGADIKTTPVKDRKILQPKRRRARPQSWVEGRVGRGEGSVVNPAAAKREVEDEDTAAKHPTTAKLPTAQADDAQMKERDAKNVELRKSTAEISSDFNYFDLQQSGFIHEPRRLRSL
ncbi:Hypothetical predicted protein [Lecanosticta acicola]|uniref:Uncharacterized protein n=1 Tax=Lecanosticta acicola TaxID=111012 RepID=A0AAI8YXG6_9PEZI|nr:Hypothetical predicted protein [Lecanosticta acicola]